MHQSHLNLQSCMHARAQCTAAAGLRCLPRLEALSIEVGFWKGGPGHRVLEVYGSPQLQATTQLAAICAT
jgi:hypothetical protein